MPVIIESGQLARAMKSAAALVERAQTMPILANVRLRSIGDHVEIATTNLDVEYRQLVPLAQPGEIDTTIEAHKLLAMAGAAEGAQMKLTPEPGKVIAQAGRSRWVMPSLGSDGFVELPFDGRGRAVTIGGAVLARILSRISWSICAEETLHYMCGVYIDPEPAAGGDVMRFTACTKNTFASFTSDIPWPEDAPPVIIATKFVRLVQGLVSDMAEVQLAWDAQKIRVTAGHATLTGKLIDGTFPPYRKVISSIPLADAPILVDPEQVRKAIKRIEIVGFDKTRCIAVDVRAGAIEVQVAGMGAGEASEHVPADCEALHRAGFNSVFLSGALECVGGETVEIHQSTPDDPALIRRTVDDGVVCGLGSMRI